MTILPDTLVPSPSVETRSEEEVAPTVQDTVVMGRLLNLPGSPNYPFRLTLPAKVETPGYGQGQGQKEEEALSLGETELPSPDDDISPLSDEPSRIAPRSAEPIRDKSELRAYMITHSLQGNKMAKSRQPFVGEVTTMVSPSDPEVTFGIKRLNNQAVMAYRDANSQVRYIMQDGDDTMTTEKDYPMGTMRVQVVTLGLDSWNITDTANNPVPVTQDAILKYLDPEELDGVYEKVMEVNPILSGNARKNS